MVQTHVIVSYWPTARDDPAARLASAAAASRSPARPLLTAAMLLTGVASLSLTYRLDAFPLDRGGEFVSLARVELPPNDLPATELFSAPSPETNPAIATPAPSAPVVRKPAIAASASPVGVGPVRRIRLEEVPVKAAATDTKLVPDAAPIAIAPEILRPARLTATAHAVPTQPGLGEQAPPTEVAAPIQSFPQVRMGDLTLGAITMRTAADGSATIHLGGLLNLFKLRLPVEDYERFSAASAAQDFVSLDELKAAGIPARLSADGSEIVIGE